MEPRVLFNFADEAWAGVYFGTRAECKSYIHARTPIWGKTVYKIRRKENKLFGEGFYGS